MSDTASILSAPCLLSLERATAAACAEVLEYAPFGQLWIHVLSAVMSVVQEQARLHTAQRSPSAKLPDELLVEIFACLSLWDRVCAATVCHRWRAVSLKAASRLWNSISHVRSLDTCGALLARAGRFPIVFRYTMQNDEAIPELCRILIEHMHHIRVLELSLPRGDPEDDSPSLIPGLAEALACDAPVLQTLGIRDPDHRLSVRSHWLSVLRNTSLQHIDFHHVKLSVLAQCGSPGTVETLRVSTDEAEFPAEDWRALSSFPALEALALRINPLRRSLPASNQPGPQLQGQLPATLRRLYLDMAWPTARHVMASTVLAKLSSWHLSLRGLGRPSFNELAPFLADDIIAATLSAARLYPRCVDVIVQSTTGQEIAIQGARWDDACWELAARVRMLRLAGLRRLSDGHPRVSVERPVVEDLTLDMTNVQQPATRLLAQPMLACHALRCLRIALPSDGPPLELEDALVFLRQTMNRGPSKLEMLCIYGVPVVSEHGMDVVAALREFADTVSLATPTEEPWQGYARLETLDWKHCVLAPQL